ncbi:MAG: YbjQ family protein [Beijerinckiaceae bacterium]|jgi:uncharacterized protein YbjQ (UPF0145 family)|nr:YbjQ family protein [Beijerinckiaceae bacterium]MDO9440364.1 heavy metal-binding domain-containing protein [Beijerinckiaceae bacterium]
MLISFSDKIDGAPHYTPIAEVRASTGWHAASRDRVREGQWKEAALEQLIRHAEDMNADAIVGVDYHIDGTTDVEDTGVELQRIAATGVAVKLRRS